MFSRNTDRPAPDDRRAVPTGPAATPQGVRDVSVQSTPPTGAMQAMTTSVPSDLSVIARADRMEGTLKVAGTLRVSLLILIGYGGLLYLTYHVMATTPAGFIPQQDKGYLLVNVQLPDAASLGRTAEQMKRLDEIARETPGVKHTVSVSGQSVLLGANAPNFATLYVMLDDFPNRLDANLGADAIAIGHTRDDHPYADDTWGKVNVVLRLRDGRVQVTREPLPEMPAELKALFQERK